MDRIIGYVCEGPRDIEMLSAIVDMLFPDDRNMIRSLQPEEMDISKNYTGWKGVLRWCTKDWKLFDEARENGIHFDALIIQLDGDVSRSEKNKQSHCACNEWSCSVRSTLINDGITLCEECQMKTEECPIQYPCLDHNSDIPDRFVDHLKELIQSRRPTASKTPSIVVIPCDSMDAWIIAANEDIDNVECIEDPWSIIACSKDYHGVRIQGNKKHKKPYAQLISMVTADWDKVKRKCGNAVRFEEEIRATLS